MNHKIDGPCVLASEKCSALLICQSGLPYNRFAERMMAVDQEIVALIQAFQIFVLWNFCKLTVCTTVAMWTGKNQIPDSIQIVICIWLEGVREEVIHITISTVIASIDVSKAVKAFSLLIPV